MTVATTVDSNPTFPDADGVPMPWPIPNGKVLIYWQVWSWWGDHSDSVTPTCTITKPDGTPVTAPSSPVSPPSYAFEYYPDVEGTYTVLVEYAGGLDVSSITGVDGDTLDPSSATFTFRVRGCYGGGVIETIDCDDGSSVITKTCVSGNITETGNVCTPVVVQSAFPWWMLVVVALGAAAATGYYVLEGKR